MSGEEMLNKLGYYRIEDAYGYRWFEKIGPKYDSTYIAISIKVNRYFKDACGNELITEEEEIAIKKYMEGQ